MNKKILFGSMVCVSLIFATVMCGITVGLDGDPNMQDASSFENHTAQGQSSSNTDMVLVEDDASVTTLKNVDAQSVHDSATDHFLDVVTDHVSSLTVDATVDSSKEDTGVVNQTNGSNSSEDNGSNQEGDHGGSGSKHGGN